jgi:signal transduction histidine kinase
MQWPVARNPSQRNTPQLPRQFRTAASDGRSNSAAALLNLIANAIDSIAVEDGPRVLSVSSEVRGGDDVVVSVADTGAGMPAHVG